jgi:hypothetical protein
MKKIGQKGGPSFSLIKSPATSASTKPLVLIDPRDDNHSVLIARQATIDALRLHNTGSPCLFQQTGHLVRLVNGLTEELNESSLAGIMIDAADFGIVKHTAKIPTIDKGFPHERLVKDVLHLKNWPEDAIPEIRRVVSSPRFTSEGRLLVEPGFDAESGIYLIPDFDMPDVPSSPTDADVEWAKDMIFRDLYADFPFVHEAGRDFYDNSSRCHTLAYMVQPFLMEFFNEPTPLFVSEAPAAGTGKTKLLQYGAIPATGKAVATDSPPTKEEEWDKNILSQLRAGVE